MARPKKIKKKKSFMFTSRHYSVLGVISFLLSVCALVSVFFSVLISFSKRGDAAMNLGGVGLFGVLACIAGVILSGAALKERDIYRWVPKTAMIIDFVCIASWAFLVVLGLVYKT